MKKNYIVLRGVYGNLYYMDLSDGNHKVFGRRTDGNLISIVLSRKGEMISTKILG